MSYRPLAIFFLGGKTLDFPSTRARKRLCWSQRTGFTASVRVPTETDLATEPTYTQYSLPHDNSLLLVVRGPRRLHEVRLGAREVLGQVLEQRDRDFDVFFFFYVVGHVLVGHR